MALVTRNALTAGRRAASLTAVGVGRGVLGWAAASAVGVGVLLERSALVYTLLRCAGAAYFVYLGTRGLLSARHAPVARVSTAAPAGSALGDRQAVRQGALGNLLNPKAGVIFVTILPQFTQPGDGPLRLALILLAFELMLVTWLNLYGSLVSRAGRSRGGGQVRRALDRITGLVLIGLGSRLVFEKR